MQQDIGRPKKTLISMSTVYSIYSVTPSICFCVHRKLNHVQSCDHPSIIEHKVQEPETSFDFKRDMVGPPCKFEHQMK